MITISHMIKNMLTNRTRLVLTILAVAWGTFSIASMLAVGEGLRLTFGGVIDNAGTGALIATGYQSTQAFRGQANGIKITLNKDDYDRIRSAFAEKASVAGEAEWSVIIYNGKKTRRGPPVLAVTPNYAKIHGINLTPGSRFINVEDEKNHRQVIVLGTKTVEKLFRPRENPIGKYVYLEKKPFLVIGVQRQTLQLLSTGSVPDNFTNWVPYSTYEEITNSRTYTNFIIAPYDLNQVPMLQNDLKHMIAHSRQLNPEDPGILEFVNLQKEKIKINLFFYSIEIVLGIIGGLTLVVAGVGIANVMYISVKRATREIGIRMALGATPFNILAYYACEALITTAIGGVFGLLMAKGLVSVINLIPMNSEILQHMGSPRPVLSMTVMIIVILVLGLIGFFAGLFPARKAALINPAEALRYE